MLVRSNFFREQSDFSVLDGLNGRRAFGGFFDLLRAELFLSFPLFLMCIWWVLEISDAII